MRKGECAIFVTKEDTHMIMDTLLRWNSYPWMNARFEDAFRFLENLKADAPEGRTEIDGKNIFCMIQPYETRAREGQRFEAHREYADIQMILEGEESILWSPVDSLTVVQAYEPDIEFYELTPEPTDLVLTPGVFCVLFPQDAHAPCIQHGASSTVRKAVVKVRLA
jgi:YhcH/YjgK/YiaL family protein